MKAYLAELIGTFALVFVGAGAGTLATGGLVGVALAHGLILAGMIYAFGHVSGTHVNPAVTIGLLATGRIQPVVAGGYLVAQLIGAALAGLALRVIFPAQELLGNTLLGDGVTVLGGFLAEMLLTFLLVTVIYGGAVDVRSPRGFAGLGIGLTLAAAILMGGPLTGASLNPARTFGPALATGNFTDFWLYLVAPILGGVLAGLLYSTFLMTPGLPEEPPDEVARRKPARRAR
ncbi:MAG: MIP/aquaporin family protein [Ardenticatenaceae bacterium]